VPLLGPRQASRACPRCVTLPPIPARRKIIFLQPREGQQDPIPDCPSRGRLREDDRAVTVDATPLAIEGRRPREASGPIRITALAHVACGVTLSGRPYHGARRQAGGWPAGDRS
jgi:hypothetical protein